MEETTGNKYQKYIRWWFWSGAGLVALILVVGGITRLTGSGLSMTDWNLIMGAFPPTTEIAWQDAFSQYKQFPEYQQLKVGMSLSEFKSIFFWEYIHRLLGRVIGLVFIIPFLWFWIRGHFTRQLLKRALLLFVLGAAQGAMGWIMVKSGLVDVPYVSHYRLAAHLILAMLLFGFCIWYALDLYDDGPIEESTDVKPLRRWSVGLLVLFVFQVIWGAFTAGLDAGYIYNTFPTMNGEWLPQNAWNLRPVITNLVENPGTVQWTHRILGTLLGMVAIGLWWKSDHADVSDLMKQKARILLGVVLTQYVLGILTVITNVEILIAVVHQAGALIVLFCWIWYFRDLKSNWATV